MNLKLAFSGEIGWVASSGDARLCLYRAGVIGVPCHVHLCFCFVLDVGARGSKAGPHAYEATILPTETSSQLSPPQSCIAL